MCHSCIHFRFFSNLENILSNLKSFLSNLKSFLSSLKSFEQPVKYFWATSKRFLTNSERFLSSPKNLKRLRFISKRSLGQAATSEHKSWLHSNKCKTVHLAKIPFSKSVSFPFSVFINNIFSIFLQIHLDEKAQMNLWLYMRFNAVSIFHVSWKVLSIYQWYIVPSWVQFYHDNHISGRVDPVFKNIRWK